VYWPVAALYVKELADAETNSSTASVAPAGEQLTGTDAGKPD
jgi:hypothetical protein